MKYAKNTFAKQEKLNDNQFVLGIDLGNSTSAISYFDGRKGQPEIIDISGGYGKVTMPTAVQYLTETDEWVFGEYALTNPTEETDILYVDLIEQLGKKKNIADIMSRYIDELISTVTSINPKAEIVGIVVSIPDNFLKEALSELETAFETSGLLSKIIDFVPHSECIFANHFYSKKAAKETVLLMDFGSRELRGSVSRVDKKEEISIRPISYMADESLGTSKIDKSLENIFTRYFSKNREMREPTEQEKTQIATFVHQYRDLVFQKNTSNKPVKLYFNFTHPAFEHVMSEIEVKGVIEPYSDTMKKFLKDLIDHCVDEKTVEFNDIDTILCTGGGFEMFWASQLVEELFPNADISMYKNSKVKAAEGATMVAAEKLGLVELVPLKFEQMHQIRTDIGILIGKDRVFSPIIEHKKFSWQKKYEAIVLVQEKPNVDFDIDIVRKEIDGSISMLDKIKIKGLEHKQGTTRLKLLLEPLSHKELQVNVTDYGFGEISKATDYEDVFIVNMEGDNDGKEL